MKFTVKPFPEDSTKVLQYDDRGISLGVSSGLASLVGINFLGLHVAAHNRNVLQNAEMTALALGSLGASNSLIAEKTKKLPHMKGDANMLSDVYDILGVSTKTTRARAHATRLAFKRGVYQPDPDAETKAEPTLQVLSGRMRERLFKLTPLAGEGLSDVDIADVTNMRPVTVTNSLRLLHDTFHMDTAGLVLLTGALGLLSQDDEMPDTLPRRADDSLPLLLEQLAAG